MPPLASHTLRAGSRLSLQQGLKPEHWRDPEAPDFTREQPLPEPLETSLRSSTRGAGSDLLLPGIQEEPPVP